MAFRQTQTSMYRLLGLRHHWHARAPQSRQPKLHRGAKSLWQKVFLSWASRLLHSCGCVLHVDVAWDIFKEILDAMYFVFMPSVCACHCCPSWITCKCFGITQSAKFGIGMYLSCMLDVSQASSRKSTPRTYIQDFDAKMVWDLFEGEVWMASQRTSSWSFVRLCVCATHCIMCVHDRKERLCVKLWVVQSQPCIVISDTSSV